MNSIAKFSLFLMTLFFCDKGSNGTLTGKWKLVKYHNLTTGSTESEPADIGRSIIIEFSDNGHMGKMNGHTVTNSVGGAYELLKNNNMKTVSFGGTKVAELGWGSKFWNAINAASAYERQGNKLFIFYNADHEKMEFTKE
jgi:hypothetical protein